MFGYFIPSSVLSLLGSDDGSSSPDKNRYAFRELSNLLNALFQIVLTSSDLKNTGSIHPFTSALIEIQNQTNFPG